MQSARQGFLTECPVNPYGIRSRGPLQPARWSPARSVEITHDKGGIAPSEVRRGLASPCLINYSGLPTRRSSKDRFCCDGSQPLMARNRRSTVPNECQFSVEERSCAGDQSAEVTQRGSRAPHFAVAHD